MKEECPIFGISHFCGIDPHQFLNYRTYKMSKRSGKRLSERETFKESVLFEASASPSEYPEQYKYTATCTDISRHGLGLTTEYELKRSQVIKLDLLSGDAKTTVPVFAEVVWTKPINDKLRAGLRFLTLSIEEGGIC